MWMLARNGVRHLASDEHKNAVDQVENAQRIQENLDRQRRAAQNVRIRVTQIPAPIAERPSVGAPPSTAELEMWADYEQNGASFTAGDEEEDVEAMHRRLAQQVDVFGLLDPKEMAERLGFEGDEAIAKDLLQIEAEDDFLAEIMANAGGCRVSSWFPSKCGNHCAFTCVDAFWHERDCAAASLSHLRLRLLQDY